jgi:thiamine transport system substrate-binding protein
MKRLATLLLALLVIGALGAVKPAAAEETLTVYSYNSIEPVSYTHLTLPTIA